MEYKLESSKLSVVVSSFGAELVSITTNDGSPILWTGKEYWKKHAPILFPFVGRLVEGRYLYNNKSYSMTKHGFISTVEFSLVKVEKDTLHLCFHSNDQTKEIYPFSFMFEVIYSLRDSKLDVKYRVTNCVDKTMYYGFGLHPGFSVPLEKEQNFEDYYVEFLDSTEDIKRVVFSPSYFATREEDDTFSLISSSILNLRHSLFDDDAICLKNTGHTLSLKSKKGGKSLTIKHDAPYLSLWHTVKEKAPFICIEPWHTLPSYDGEILDIEKREDFAQLREGESNSYFLSIEVDEK